MVNDYTVFTLLNQLAKILYNRKNGIIFLTISNKSIYDEKNILSLHFVAAMSAQSHLRGLWRLIWRLIIKPA